MSDTPEQKLAELRSLIQKERSFHERAAIALDLISTTTFYSSLLFGALAVIAGLIKSFAIPSEAVSILAAISTGLNFLYQQARFRSKADWFYGVRDEADQVLMRIRFELPASPTHEDVVNLSRDWRAMRLKLGREMGSIHKAEEDRATGSLSTKPDTSSLPREEQRPEPPKDHTGP